MLLDSTEKPCRPIFLFHRPAGAKAVRQIIRPQDRPP